MTRWTRTARLAMIVAHATCVLALGARVEAQSGANVLVVVNSASTASETIGRAYAARRNVPPGNVCSITLPPDESVSRDVYEARIEQPIWKCIATRQAHDRILYILLTKGVPIRVSGTAGRTGTNASVDSELTLLYRRRTGTLVPVVGFVPNPYFADGSHTDIAPFTHQAHDIYLVTRIDGYTLDDALSLIDRAASATADGRFILDQRGTSSDLIPNRWLSAAAARMSENGLSDRVLLDESTKVVTGEPRVLGYYSWGSSDESIRVRNFDLHFLPGALAGMFVSTDGRTFKEPPATWRPGGENWRNASFAGSAESLIGDLIRAGVTGVAGNVDEPYLDAAIRPDILFPAYAGGRNLAEAFYAAMPYLSWQTLIVGDPLCAPFPRGPIAAASIDPPIDEATEAPLYFGRRQLATMPPALPIAAAAAYMRFQSRTLREDEAGARRALEAAIVAEPRFIPARLELAAIDERIGDRDQAIAQYRMILLYSPNDPVVLNNLAYALAVYRSRPDEALPFAERANFVARIPPAAFGGTHELASQYMVGNYDPEATVASCLDTLAWVQHLLGRDLEAATTIRQARAAGAQEAVTLWHAAVIYAATNNTTMAAAELSAALKADPNLANRDEIQRLRQTLGLVGKHPAK